MFLVSSTISCSEFHVIFTPNTSSILQNCFTSLTFGKLLIVQIPSIKSALILSSNDDYREFVQRRGRILRLYENKKSADIYDVVVLPSNGLTEWAKIELRRFLEYARLALNYDELQLELEDLLYRYGLELEDIDVYDYEDMEVDIDE